MTTYTVERTASLEEWRNKYNSLSDLLTSYGLYITNETGSAILPKGTEAQRDSGSPLEEGYIRFNSDINLLEFYDGLNWNYLPSLANLFETFDGSSTTFVDGNITEINYSNGYKNTFSYTGNTQIVVNYYGSDSPATLLATNTINFVNDDLSSTEWDYNP